MMTTDDDGSSGYANDTHQALLDERTRTVLEVLRDRTEPITLSSLAAEVVRAGFRASGSAHVAGGCIEDTEVRLHHADLPRLHELGVVEYDPECHLVCRPASPDGNWSPR